jgi:glutaredoxin
MEPVKRKKLTKEIVNERLSSDGRGIQLIGEYQNASTKTLFQCSREHQWKTTYRTIYNGRGCPVCAGKMALSKEIVNERLMKAGHEIQLIGDYISTHTKTLFRCSKGHQWMTKYSTIYGGTGCPTCAGTGTMLSSKQVQQRLLNDGRGIELVGEYNGANKKNEFQCAHGHKWMTKYGNIYSGDGCPSCAKSGFTGDKPAWRYVLVFKESKIPFIKFGITNSLDQRMYTHRKHNGEFEIAWTHHDENGHDTLVWENQIKKTFGGRYVSKDECPDGFTETLPLSMLNEIIRK